MKVRKSLAEERIVEEHESGESGPSPRMRFESMDEGYMREREENKKVI